MSLPMDWWWRWWRWWWRRQLFGTLCVVCTGFVYVPALSYPLLYDDVAAIERNADVQGPLSLSSLLTNDFWGTPLTANFSHQSYRPLTVLTFRIFGDTYRQRVVNAALHVLNCVLLAGLLKRFIGAQYATTGAILFCIHPVNVEAVVQLVGRAELLCATFYLGCVLCRSYPLACLLTVVAALCKEQGVTALPVKVVLDTIEHLSDDSHRHRQQPQPEQQPQPQQQPQPEQQAQPEQQPEQRQGPTRVLLWKQLLLSTVVSICLVGARLTISAGRAPVFHKLDNPARHLEFPFRQINFAYLAVFNFFLALDPHKQSCDYTFNSVPLIGSYSDARLVQLGLFGLVALAAARELLLRKPLRSYEIAVEDKLTNNNNNSHNSHNSHNNNRINPMKQFERRVIPTASSVPLAAVTMLLVPYLPASNLVFYVGFVVAERVLYLPSMGFCFLVAFGYSRLIANLPQKKNLFRAALLFLASCFLLKSSIRSRQWQTEVRLFSSALRVFPENIKMWNNLGKAYENEGDFHLALSCFDHSTTIYDELRAHWYKAKLLTKLNRNELAEAIYQTQYESVISKLRHNSNGSSVRREEILFIVDYVRLLIKVDALHRAKAIVFDTLAIFPQEAALNVVAGELFYNLNDKVLAENSYRKALDAAPTIADIYYNLGVLLMERGASDKAADMFQKCIELNPQHEPSRVNLNVLNTNTEDAQMMQLYKDAMDSLREGAYAAAESLLHRVLSRNPHHLSALYNLALLQTQLGRPPAVSLSFLSRLLSLRPSHSKGLLLKANIAHRQLRDINAAIELYAKAYSVDRSLESALEALCDLSPSRAFRFGGNCNRDVEFDAATRTNEIPQFDRTRIDL